jgi:hypothetical protein
MNTPIWAPWLVVALFSITSIILLTGKGSFLIAGYNMMSITEKQKYNEKRLCRVMGGGLGVISIMLGIATIYRFEMPAAIAWFIPWGLFGVIAVMLILANTICKQTR